MRWSSSKTLMTVWIVPIGKVLFWFGFMWSGVFSVVCIFLTKKIQPLKALKIYSSAKLRFKIYTRPMEIKNIKKKKGKKRNCVFSLVAFRREVKSSNGFGVANDKCYCFVSNRPRSVDVQANEICH